MLHSYITLALRHLAQNRLFSLINITGLTIGLMVFLFGSLLVRYEKNHDHMFDQREQIFTVSSIFTESADIGIKDYPNIRLSYAPLFQRLIPEAKHIVRSVQRDRIVRFSDSQAYYNIRFVDPGFTQVFNFDYVHGGPDAIERSDGLILARSVTMKLFGHTDVIGQRVILQNQHPMIISAVIEDIAADSHFNSSLLPDAELTMIAPMQALVALGDFSPDRDWNSFHPGDLTYVLLPKHRDRNWLQAQVDQVWKHHTPPAEHDFVSRLRVDPLVQANTKVWDSLGFPVLEAIQLLGLLVLIAACLNTINLTTVQNFGRAREVGLRKAYGATRKQLWLQFLSEGLILTLLATLLAVASIELLLPQYNHWTEKVVALDYQGDLPALLIIAIGVGLIAGAYPAYLISRNRPIDSLHSVFLKSSKGRLTRHLMIAAQFAIGIFILAMVMIIYFQNRLVKELSDEFPRDSIVLLERIDEETIKPKQPQLVQALNTLSYVHSVTLSEAVPFDDMDRMTRFSTNPHDFSGSHEIRLIAIDDQFMSTYEIELITGRYFDLDVTQDVFDPKESRVNVIVNQMAADRLGLSTESDSQVNNVDKLIGKIFYSQTDQQTSSVREYQIIGVMPDQYFLGVAMRLRPLVFYIHDDLYRFASIQLGPDSKDDIHDQLTQIWEKHIDDFPIRIQSLNSYFNRFYRIPSGISLVLATFAMIALSLALIGLFGLAAFMSKRRTKEIGIRKVMGASNKQIMRLLIWQISTPVLWSFIVAMPLAYLASDIYLAFFQDRISFVLPLIALAGLIALSTAWVIVSGHVMNVSRTRPVHSLRKP